MKYQSEKENEMFNYMKCMSVPRKSQKSSARFVSRFRILWFRKDHYTPILVNLHGLSITDPSEMLTQNMTSKAGENNIRGKHHFVCME